MNHSEKLAEVSKEEFHRLLKADQRNIGCVIVDSKYPYTTNFEVVGSRRLVGRSVPVEGKYEEYKYFWEVA